MCTDPCDTWLYIVVLKGEVMVVDERYDNEPQDLITVSVCIQIAVDEMHMGWLFIGYSHLY